MLRWDRSRRGIAAGGSSVARYCRPRAGRSTAMDLIESTSLGGFSSRRVFTTHPTAPSRDETVGVSGRSGVFPHGTERPTRLGSALREVAGLLGADQQLVLGVDERFAPVVGQLVVLLEVDRVLGTRLLAHAAEDAAQHVDLVPAGVPLPVGPGVCGVVLGGLDEDRVGRTGNRAQLASDAALEAILVPGQDVQPPGT